MRVFVFWVAVCLTNSALAQSSPSLSPVRVSPQLSAEIGPHGRTYMACALQHIQRVATANPSTAFEQHELSIRPACGAHVNQIVLAFLRYGHPQENANLWIRNAYTTFRPQLQRAFAATAAQSATAVPPPTDAPLIQAERGKVQKATLDDIKNCLHVVVREVVPFSDENAETLATAIQARCDHRYDLRRSAAIVLYGASDQVRTALASEREKDRRALLAQIVTF
jgi:hypothetical protein